MMISGSAAKPSPATAMAAVDAERRLREVQPRPQFPHGNYVEFADSIAAEIQALPREAGDPDLARALDRGPVVPSQFRLDGPHANLPIASATVIEAYRRTKNE
jgi:dimethylaniline monooxygenase (N-oxide forming)